MIRLSLIVPLLCVLILPCLAFTQDRKSAGAPEDATSRDMKRLAVALAGDCNNVETMERNEFFRKGGGRGGIMRWGLTTGGTRLRREGDSGDSDGKFSQ